MTLSLNIDALKHSLGQWETDPTGAGHLARHLAQAVTREHVGAGYDVVVGQYLAKTNFIDRMEALAAELRAEFTHFVLVVDQRTLASRLLGRARAPERLEHRVTSQLLSEADVPRLVSSMEALVKKRPSTVPIDASDTPADTMDRILVRLYDDGL